ncbi:hypothetical protein JY651_08110 [Pyxidicoccus parkwayensis]|uniref:Uncharacterized protein n=1 Tax=Pyxidicoccus parkwayensis TaxID=2813578 RepID=A0ABX7P352_9BACT|nr:hypothetical protein [Pyxidicoccus parkwaysis]QSQ24891.1 hypothetical protein JY651_08110 [Pyxidicoccus parkwaysis]
MDAAQLLPTTPLEVLDQYPSASVEVSLKSSDSPAYRAVVIRAASSASPAKLNEELTAVAEDMPKLLESALERPDARDHLLSPPLTRAQRARGRLRKHLVRTRQLAARRWKDVALVAAVAGFLGLLWHRPQPAPAESSRVAVTAPVQQQPGQDALTSSVGEAAVNELDVVPPVPLFEPNGTLLIALDMPNRPFKGQKKPDCRKSQESINGGCWVKVAAKPPCGDDFYEHDDACWAPVMVRDGKETTQPISK